ncbi:MAG: 4-alpha-glucanotransferase [Steroidobacteraceae bacterium]
MPESAFERRRAGVLLHLTALDRDDGRGALGLRARDFIDWLAGAGFRVWQILPVGPTGTDGSPYWVRSDHAGNPALLDGAELPVPRGPDYERFVAGAGGWLPDWALHEALRAAHDGLPWLAWPAALRDRHPDALQAARQQHAPAIGQEYARQYAFAMQWQALRRHAAARGVSLFGDLPIYVAPDSVETWCHRAQFQLDADGRPRAIAGVPPDYFAADGQLWGNPLYDWQVMRNDGFRWWRTRIAAALQRFDLLRLDHFRGFESHWAVPAGASNARGGTWQPTPGDALLDAVARDLGAATGNLPLVAEDLGVITPEVDALRRRWALPGMHVIQFGFDGSGDNPHLPHMHRRRSVAYTGTHDNDTVTGWLQSLDGETLRRVEHFFGARGDTLAAAVVRAALGSVSALTVVPVQDLLGLGTEARFNTPGTVQGNWCWRLPVGRLDDAMSRQFSLLNRSMGRA